MSLAATSPRPVPGGQLPPGSGAGRLQAQAAGPIRLGPCLTATLCVLSILTLVLTKSGGEYLLPAVNGLLILAVLAVAAVRRPMDLTRSFFWLNCVLFAMFVLHPMSLIATGTLDQFYLFRFDRRPFYEQANLLATVSIIASNLPFLLMRGSASVPWRPTAPPLQARTTRNVGYLCIGLAVIGSAYLYGTGFYDNQSSGQAGLGRTAYTYFLPTLVVPGIVLLLMSNSRQRSAACVAVAAGAALVDTLLLIGNGQRTGLVLILGGPLVYLSRSRRWRLPRVVALLLVPVLLFAFGALRDANSKGMDLWSAVGDSVRHPGVTLLSTLTGQDTGMVDAVSLEMQVVPSQIPFEPFVTPLSIVSAPVPRILWPGKPVSADIVLNTYLLSRSNGQASIAYSVVGEGYLAGGVLGVAGLSFVYGSLFAYWDRRSRRSAGGGDLWLGLGALMPALVPTIVRGISAYNVAYMGFVFLPLVLAAALSRRGAVAPDRRSDGLPRRFDSPRRSTAAALPMVLRHGPRAPGL